MTVKIALRKVRKERMWSLSIAGLLVIGLTTWMVVPSISASLQTGLSSYNNNVATYLFVYNTGFFGYTSRIPPNVTDAVMAVPGVQQVYPVVINWTYFYGGSLALTFDNGSRLSIPGALEGDQSTVIGGQGGFPSALLTISAGRLPNDEAMFITNGLANPRFPINKTQIVLFSVPSQNRSSTDSIYHDSHTGKEYMKFNATSVGQMPYNPMLQQSQILWNSAFLKRQLGEQLYEQTFGGEGANYYIIKAQDIGQVEQVSTELKAIFADYPGYSVMYDETTVRAQLSFQSNSAIFYQLIGIASLFSVVSLLFVFTYVFSGRRRWEVGLLLTQGWSWRKVINLYFYYYMVIGAVAIIGSISLALFISSQIGFSFQVYASTLSIPLLISPYLLASSVIVALLVSSIAAYFAIWSMRKMGLDNLLREF